MFQLLVLLSLQLSQLLLYPLDLLLKRILGNCLTLDTLKFNLRINLRRPHLNINAGCKEHATTPVETGRGIETRLGRVVLDYLYTF